MLFSWILIVIDMAECVVFALAEVTVMRYLTKLFTNIRKFIEKKCNKA